MSELDAPERLRKGMGAYPIPVIVLARLAVAQRIRAGESPPALLRDAMRRALVVSEQAGVRELLTHPLDENAAAFYRRFGFIDSPVQEAQMLLLLS